MKNLKSILPGSYVFIGPVCFTVIFLAQPTFGTGPQTSLQQAETASGKKEIKSTSKAASAASLPANKPDKAKFGSSVLTLLAKKHVATTTPQDTSKDCLDKINAATKTINNAKEACSFSQSDGPAKNFYDKWAQGYDALKLWCGSTYGVMTGEQYKLTWVATCQTTVEAEQAKYCENHSSVKQAQNDQNTISSSCSKSNQAWGQACSINCADYEKLKETQATKVIELASTQSQAKQTEQTFNEKIQKLGAANKTLEAAQKNYDAAKTDHDKASADLEQKQQQVNKITNEIAKLKVDRTKKMSQINQGKCYYLQTLSKYGGSNCAICAQDPLGACKDD